MKRLLLVPILLLASCMATSGALNTLSLKIADAEQAALAAKAAADNPEVTQAELDAIVATMVEKAKEAKDAALAVKDAVKADIANNADRVKGITGFGMGADGGVLGLGLTALAWWMRDRRKKAGMDPLQRSDVTTPPTTV